jgi:hypothetical protein
MTGSAAVPAALDSLYEWFVREEEEPEEVEDPMPPGRRRSQSLVQRLRNGDPRRPWLRWTAVLQA